MKDSDDMTSQNAKPKLKESTVARARVVAQEECIFFEERDGMVRTVS
jgi:hypothetical protein